MKKTALVTVILLLCHCMTGLAQRAAAQPERHFPRISIYSNLAHDFALIPNLGVQVGVFDDWSVSLSWNHSWWGGEGHSWKVYGPELTVRRYFSGRNADRSYTGHHAGLYTQVITYDIQRRGGTGYLGGEPGGNLFDGANWGTGLEYGYTFRLNRQLDLDLSIGLGYFGGKYYSYEYTGGQYIWQSTAHRNYWGPTRLGVTLIWNLPL